MSSYPYPKTVGGKLKATYNALDFQDTTLTSTSVNNNYVKTTGGSITGSLNVSETTTSGSVITNGETILNGGCNINCVYPSSPFVSYYYNNGGTGYGNQLRMYKANGTKASPTNVMQNDLLSSIQSHGYDTASGFHARTVGILCWASQNYTSSTTNRSYITFESTADNVGFSPNERLQTLLINYT